MVARVYLAYTDDNTSLHGLYSGVGLPEVLSSVVDTEDTIPALLKGLTGVLGQLSNVLTNLEGLAKQYEEEARVKGFGEVEYVFVNLDGFDASGFNNKSDYIEVLPIYYNLVSREISRERIIVVHAEENLIKNRRPYIITP